MDKDSSFTIGVPEEFTQNLNEDVKKHFMIQLRFLKIWDVKLRALVLNIQV